jgi:hypothetical protein
LNMRSTANSLLLAILLLSVSVVQAKTNSDVLLVVGDSELKASEALIRASIEKFGYSVEVITDESVQTSDGYNKRLIVISSSVQSGLINTKFTHSTSPIVTWESHLYDDLKMTGSSSGVDYGTSLGDEIAILDPNHEVAAGLSGIVSVSSTNEGFSWGRPGASAWKIASLSNDHSKITLFKYEKNSHMVGLTAPARRVALFLTDNTNLTYEGLLIAKASIIWALEGSGGPAPAPVNTPPTVSIIAPKIGQVYQSGQTVNISADATDVDGSINRVNFYAGPTIYCIQAPCPPSREILLGTEYIRPYTASWVPGVGSWTITAEAVDNEGATSYTETYISVVAAAPPPKDPPSSKTALLITGASYNKLDADIKSTLEQLGFYVIQKIDYESNTSDAYGTRLVLISASATASYVNTKFRSVAVPLVTWNSGLFDDLGLTSTNSSYDYGTSSYADTIYISDPAHDVAAGLSGQVKVASSKTSTGLSWGRPGGSAWKIATLINDSSKVTMFKYEWNTNMVGLVAPQRRIALFMTANSSLTSAGWALVRANIIWAEQGNYLVK